MDKETEVVVATKEEREYFLPAEVLTIIFGFLDPRTLVLRCRLVCKFWKETIESPNIWKTQIRRHAVSNSVVGESVLRTAHIVYPWYVCHGLCNNIFGKNLFPTDIAQGTLRYFAVNEFHHDGHGGRIYSSPMGSVTRGFKPPAEELISEGITDCLMVSIDECSIDHSIDLYALGFSPDIMDMRPPIYISEWFCVRQNFIAVYHIDVTLVTSNKETDYVEQRNFFYRKQTDSMDWYKVSHTFKDYGPAVRYISFHHGLEIFYPPLHRRLRHYDRHDVGSKIAGSKVIICLPELDGASTSEQDNSDDQ